MANVFITSDYTITDVRQCNTASDTEVWYTVTYKHNDLADSTVYVTPTNDAKFPKGLAKTDFMANALPLINTYHDTISNSFINELTDWDTEA